MRSRRFFRSSLWARILYGGCLLAKSGVHLSCVHASGERPKAVVVMPVDVLGTATEGERLRRASEQAIEELGTPVVLDAQVTVVLAELGATLRQCDDPCLTAVGKTLEADAVLVLALGGFGQTRVIRSRVLAVSRGMVVHDSEEPVVGGVDALEAHAAQLARRLFPSADLPWYRRWLVWSAVALGIGATTTTAVLLTRGEHKERRVVHVGDLK